MGLILLIIILLLLFGGGGGYYGYRRWGTGGGVGIVGLVLIILVILYLFVGTPRIEGCFGAHSLMAQNGYNAAIRVNANL